MASLDELTARLDRIAGGDLMAKVASGMAHRALDLVDQGYRNRTDPYGVAWLPTKQPNPILERTGAFRSSWRIVAVMRDGFTIGDGVRYGGFHQYGTHVLPRRMTIPDADRGLGSWAVPLAETAKQALGEALGAR